jgi:hypothetical protein
MAETAAQAFNALPIWERPYYEAFLIVLGVWLVWTTWRRRHEP